MVPIEELSTKTNIWGHFWSEYWYLTPCGGHTKRYSLLFGYSFWRNDLIICFKCLAALHHLMVKTWRLLAKHHYFWSFLIKIGKFDPPGCWYTGTPATVWYVILKRHYHASFLKCLCGCIVQINGSNWGVINKTLIFGVIFGQNMGIWPPVVVILWCIE